MIRNVLAHPVVVFCCLAATAFGILLMAYYPGLLISDAMTGYTGAIRGYVDDGYGIFWNVMIIGLSYVTGSPLLLSVLQCTAYIATAIWFFGMLRRASLLIRYLAVIPFLSPVFLVSVFYQHRDTAFALAFFALVVALLRKESRVDAVVVLTATLCCLFRPDFIPAYVLGVLVALVGAHRLGTPWRDMRIALWAVAPVIAILFRLLAPEVLPVAHRGDAQKAALTIQPLCAIVEEQRAYDTLSEDTRAAIEAAFSRDALEERCAVRNIWIFWTSDNAFVFLDEDRRRAYFEAVREAIAGNVPLVAGRAVATHLSANGIGHELAGFMDFLKDPDAIEPQFSAELIDTSPRNVTLRRVLEPLVDGSWKQGFAAWRAILMNSLIVLALVLALHRFGRAPLVDAAVAMVVLRSLTLLAAPSAQYAYHFPVHLAGMALLVWLLTRRTDGTVSD